MEHYNFHYATDTARCCASRYLQNLMLVIVYAINPTPIPEKVANEVTDFVSYVFCWYEVWQGEHGGPTSYVFGLSTILYYHHCRLPRQSISPKMARIIPKLILIKSGKEAEVFKGTTLSIYDRE